ncbi:conserved hypothetical protein [Ricinus communis]|uniref:Reverse transcriptase zinc-binding domain-containing protein n=1 Tax=Ricinus communis TaxID=3988 RepID=B9SLC1_RICCO|nr:conserved hypothetical protein [Ricinus communis]
MTVAKGIGGMEFREMMSFNEAFLAKEWWHFINNPSSLWARVLKGIYFPNQGFFEAKLGDTLIERQGFKEWAHLAALTDSSASHRVSEFIRPLSSKMLWFGVRNREQETVEHLLFFCGHAFASWFASSLAYKPSRIGFSNILSGWRNVSSLFSGRARTDSMSWVAYLCWNIWLSKNDAIFLNKPPDPIKLVFHAEVRWRELAELLPRANVSQRSSVSNPLDTCWLPPQRDSVKVNPVASFVLALPRLVLGLSTGTTVVTLWAGKPITEMPLLRWKFVDDRPLGHRCHFSFYAALPQF